MKKYVVGNVKDENYSSREKGKGKRKWYTCCIQKNLNTVTEHTIFKCKHMKC